MKASTRLLVAALLATSVLLPSFARAQAYPSKPVRLIVPFAAGGGTDLLARTVAQKVGEHWKQTVVVENRAGADSIIASETVAKSPADGHTLFLATLGALGLNPHLYRKLPYDPAKDFAGVSFVADSPFEIGRAHV